MTAIELNAQLLRQISYIADNESYLQKPLDFINKLTKSKSATVVRGAVYTELLERLSDFQEYKKGWDGDDALPLNSQVVKNFKKVLQKSADSDLTGWTIFPAANGTLLLQNKERKSGIVRKAEMIPIQPRRNASACPHIETLLVEWGRAKPERECGWGCAFFLPDC